jgi:adenosylcobinamide kinase / adenosylcobinamide-phosphate guanylyltransferase
MPHLTLILGGARSGKSRQAEALVMRHPAPWTYIATAEALDDEMRHRIALHRSSRGDGWRLLEAPVHLDVAVRSANGPILIDCLTLWISNLMQRSSSIADAATALEAALATRDAPAVVVSNEVGLGIVPDNPLARRFRDQAGWLNQRMAAMADSVLLVVAGLPVRCK